jgi:hypothetical protein
MKKEYDVKIIPLMNAIPAWSQLAQIKLTIGDVTPLNRPWT